MPFDALVVPSDDRAPHLVALMTTPIDPAAGTVTAEPYRCRRMPHPEVFMDYIAEGMGPRSWSYHVRTSPYIPSDASLIARSNTQLVEALDCMTKTFSTPYIIFYPTVSRDGMAFPINKFIREAQGRFYKESAAWRGNIVVAKYRDTQFSAMTNISMADFPILKNYLSTHSC